MKQIIFFLSLLVMAPLANAQRYSCIPAEQKTFFTNGIFYLRGMRIDSVKYAGTDKTYYPFKTARYREYVDTVADTAGGSWWGSMVIEDTLNGITAIPTRYGDTVWIQTRAALNDQWTFYQDTAVRYYEAKVIALDTSTIAGISDSVKIIRIIAKEGNVVVSSDSLNGLELVLSQHHGLLQAIDFYLFPYDVMDASSDYYFSLSQINAYFSKAAFTFRRVPFRFPNQMDMYDYDTGDVIARVHDDYFTNYHSRTVFKINGKSVTDSNITYATNNGTFIIPDTMMFNATKMPEEYYNPVILYYQFKDSAYCIQSPAYMPSVSSIWQRGLFAPGEWDVRDVYKETIGEIYHSQVNDSWSYSEEIVSIKRNGIACDVVDSVLDLMNTLVENKNILVYPNPANNIVTVSSESDKVFSVQILDLTGRLLIQQSSRGERLTIPVENLPNGLYLLKVSSGNDVLTKKLSVLH